MDNKIIIIRKKGGVHCWTILGLRSPKRLENKHFKAISYTVGFRQSKTVLFDWIFFRLDSSGPSSYRQSSRLYSFCALPRGGWCEGALLYGSRKSVGSSVLRAFFVNNACFARNEPSSKRVGGVGLSGKPPKLRSWRCTQPRAAKARAGVAVVGKTASITRAAAVVCDTHCWRAELGVRLADSQREATAVIAKPASVLLYDSAVWYMAWVCGRVGVCFVVG